MAEVLEILLPQLFPQEIDFQVVPHEGKSDLERSVPSKLKAWREPGVRFVVMRDNDNANCIEIKDRLTRLCLPRPDTLVRVVCHELESWYLADLAAVAKAYGLPSLAPMQNRRIYRDPDSKPGPSKLLQRIVPKYSKMAGARLIGPHLDLNNERSQSFRAFVAGVRRIVKETRAASGYLQQSDVMSVEEEPNSD